MMPLKRILQYLRYFPKLRQAVATIDKGRHVRRTLITAFVFVVFIWAVPSFATDYYAKQGLFTQVRENSLSEREFPLSYYLDAGLKGLPQSGSFDVSFFDNKVFKNPTNDNTFDLYQAVFRMNDIGDLVSFSAGRQFVNAGSTYLIDGAEISFKGPEWPVKVGLLGGVPRYIETGDFHGKIGLIGGGYLELQGLKNYQAKLSLIYDKVDIHKTKWEESDTLLIGFYNANTFDVSFKPTLFANVEYNAGGNNLETGTGGISIQPNRRLYAVLEGGACNTNREWQRPTIFSLFTSGPFYQGRAGISYKLIDSVGAVEDLILRGGYALQRYDVQQPLATTGHLADAGIGFSILPINMDVSAGYSFYDSYGGMAHDFVLAIHEEPIDKLYIDAGGNVTKYSKVTNVKDVGYSAYLTSGYELLKGFILSVGGEYLKNNTFNKEFRATAMLSYTLQGSI